MSLQDGYVEVPGIQYDMLTQGGVFTTYQNTLENVVVFFEEMPNGIMVVNPTNGEMLYLAHALGGNDSTEDHTYDDNFFAYSPMGLPPSTIGWQSVLNNPTCPRVTLLYIAAFMMMLRICSILLDEWH